MKINSKFARFCIWTGIIVVALAIIILAAWFSTGKIRSQASQNYLKNAQELLIKSKYDEAVLDLNKAVFFDAKNHQAWYELGKIHRSFFEYEKASQCFLRAYQSTSNQYLMAYVESSLKAEENSRAQIFLENLDDSDLKNILLWLVQAQDQKLDQSQNSVQKIDDPDQKNYFLALNYLLAENYQKFENTLAKTKISKADLGIPEFVIWKLQPSKNSISALNQLKNKLGSTQIPESKSLYTYQTFTELGLGFLVQDPLEDLAGKNPTYRDAWIVLGEIYYLERDYETALEKLRLAEKLDYNYLPTLKLLAKTYEALDSADKVSDYNSRIQKLSY